MTHNKIKELLYKYETITSGMYDELINLHEELLSDYKTNNEDFRKTDRTLSALEDILIVMNGVTNEVNNV